MSETSREADRRAIDDLFAENERMKAILTEISHLQPEDMYRADGDNTAAVLARSALEPPGCPTPGACSCPDGAGEVVSGKLEWRDGDLWIGGINTGGVAKSDQVWVACMNTNIIISDDVTWHATESEARAAVEQAVRAAIVGGKGEA